LLALAVDPNGVDGFLTQQRKGEVQVWEVDSRRRTGPAIVPGTESVFSVAFNHDGTLLATGSPGQLDLWDVATHARHGKPMKVADDGVFGVAFDPSGRLVAEGGVIGPVRVWRVADQQPAFPPLSAGPTAGPFTVTAFDPAGSFLATTGARGGPGCGSPPRVSATAASWSPARGPAQP
jgi:WD40 repeat protein